MDLQDIKKKIQESREEKSSLLEALLSESFDTATIVNTIVKYKNQKITNEDIDKYSKDIRTLQYDPIVFELQEQSKYKINGKLLFIHEGQVIALSKDSNYRLENSWTIDQIKESIKKDFYG